MIWGGADLIIIEIKHVINVMPLNHPEPPHQPSSRKKLSSMQLVPGAKRVELNLMGLYCVLVCWSLQMLFQCFFTSEATIQSLIEMVIMTFLPFPTWGKNVKYFIIKCNHSCGFFKQISFVKFRKISSIAIRRIFFIIIDVEYCQAACLYLLIYWYS